MFSFTETKKIKSLTLHAVRSSLTRDNEHTCIKVYGKAHC